MDPSVPTLPEPDRLERLVTLVDASVAERGWHAPHILIKVEDPGDPEAFDLGFKDLPEGSHPADELWGFRAPNTWLAIGVVTYGWIGPMFEGRPSRHPDRRRVRLTSIVDRTGNEASTASVDDGTFIDEPGKGLIADVLRCCIGASTAPPPPLDVLTDRLWLMHVADASAGRSLGWPKVEAMRVAPDSTWERLRMIAAGSGSWPFASEWMDDGFFARELLARLPSVDELLEQLDRQLSRSASRKLREVIERGREAG